MTNEEQVGDQAGTGRKALRKKLLTGIGGAVALAAVAYGGWSVFGPDDVSTDNAYVGADVAQVTPLVGGAVQAVNVSDTQTVRAGDLLVVIDDADARNSLAEAEAQLAQAQNRFGQTSATGGALAAQVTAREADIVRARAQLAAAEADWRKAQTDLARRRSVGNSGAVSGQEITDAVKAEAAARADVAAARATVQQAIAARTAAQGEVRANRAVAGGTNAGANPEVTAARVKVEQAKLALARTRIRAPIDGVVARRQVQVGQQLAPGAQIMTIVPLAKVYVDANFKEGQLRGVRVGQPVRLTSDLYGDDVVYHGRVAGFAGGTGSAFSLIPAQNATGNWIKVVQRVPVRISLDPAELKAHPLRVGLSMDAEIDLSAKS
ncbi:efflux RND transporter periplasmic adaptor subunit [Sphingosinicella sp. BN140058]|uniref:HlyD family secretion protein n=1 Tax=Sphingosinicella sp. BN140058 TaxID=1892855 RepID=UPI001011502B|nr:efflux RND transporter periplasmic adaptor subunit [Sphingosinicella sp. BN140058]QAY75859.1 HlyD family efflux transporter periplasmic adaptor subunit [Sphingosinicella sp. BN140058]